MVTYSPNPSKLSRYNATQWVNMLPTERFTILITLWDLFVHGIAIHYYKIHNFHSMSARLYIIAVWLITNMFIIYIYIYTIIVCRYVNYWYFNQPKFLRPLSCHYLHMLISPFHEGYCSHSVDHCPAIASIIFLLWPSNARGNSGNTVIWCYLMLTCVSCGRMWCKLSHSLYGRQP